jgi:hypothetical protein
MNWIKTIFVQLLVGFVFLEGLSYTGSKLSIFIVNDTPTLYRSKIASSAAESFYEGRTEREAWGAWREVNSITRQVSTCFDVEISTNEIGARDNSFEQLAGENIVLLGDSFAEGFGVSYTQTAQYLLEQSLGVNLLNFGTAGNFGPLQQYIIYRDLAQDFEHESVLIFVLPANDFTDNDSTYWAASMANRKRYRPYYSGSENPITPFYFPEAIPTDVFAEYSSEAESENIFGIVDVKRFIAGNLWLSNPLRSFSYLVTKKDVTDGTYYLSASEQQQIDMISAYSEIVKIASGKPVSFVIIPTKRDFDLLGNNRELLSSQAWYQNLNSLATNSGGVFIDLSDFEVPNIDEMFHSCDGHWSDFGNRWAAEAISMKLSEQ